MGKKNKPRNPGVGVDFKRVKHKVGKKLRKAQNETDVSNIKSHVLSLPGQSLREDKGDAVNFQNLTFKVGRSVGDDDGWRRLRWR